LEGLAPGALSGHRDRERAGIDLLLDLLDFVDFLLWARRGPASAGNHGQGDRQREQYGNHVWTSVSAFTFFRELARSCSLSSSDCSDCSGHAASLAAMAVA